jgi:hypothetical protein
LEKPTKAVLRLVGHISKTNMNIKADILIYSLEVFNKLTEKGLIFVGTLKKGKVRSSRTSSTQKLRTWHFH